MKLLVLSKDERRMLQEMGIFHPHPRTRMRAQGILRLSHGLTLQQTADEFMVHLTSVEQWWQRWDKLGLAGLYEGHHTGWPKKWASRRRQALGELAQHRRRWAKNGLCLYHLPPYSPELNRIEIRWEL
ncbi:MAG: helix-turn-helix domain-containing protein [Pseudomonadota bacterium]|nr:helix-turn-helix domain-containing protein [Pseudomonadota bacterium]